MPSVPSNLSLDLAIGPEIKADEHINNYTAIQAALNAIIAILDGGTISDVLTVGGGGPDWSSITPAATVPTGAVTPYAAAAAPAGWLLCDGSAVSRTTYSALFGVLSTTYGVGDGSTTFNVPDLRGRMPAGFAASGGHTDVAALGNNDGVAVASRRPKHAHTVTDPGHQHPIRASAGGGGAGAGTGAGTLDTFGAGGARTTGISVGAAGMTDTPGYIVLNFIVKT